MTRCPYCSNRTNPLRLVLHTRYRCSRCKKESRARRGASALVVAIVLMVGVAASHYFFAPGLLGELQLLAFMLVSITIAVWLFLRLYPIETEPNQAPEPTPTTVTPPAGQEARQP